MIARFVVADVPTSEGTHLALGMSDANFTRLDLRDLVAGSTAPGAGGP
jgi:hypothetical protein